MNSISNSRGFFEVLPEEIVVHPLLSQLDPISLGRMQLVSTYFFRIIQEESLWKRLYRASGHYSPFVKKGFKDCVTRNYKFLNAVAKGELKKVYTLDTLQKFLESLNYMDEKLFLIVDDASDSGAVMVEWDRDTGKQSIGLPFKGNIHYIRRSTVCADGMLLFIQGEKIDEWKWSPEQNAWIDGKNWSCHQTGWGVKQLAYSEGVLVSVGDTDSLIKVWKQHSENKDWICQKTLQYEAVPTFQTLVYAEGMIVLNFSGIKILTWKGNAEKTDFQSIEDLECGYRPGPLVLGNERLFLGWTETEIRIFSLNSEMNKWEHTQSLEGHHFGVTDLLYKDEILFSAASSLQGNELKVWQLEKQNQKFVHRQDLKAVQELGSSALLCTDGMLFSGSNLGTIRIWSY